MEEDDKSAEPLNSSVDVKSEDDVDSSAPEDDPPHQGILIFSLRCVVFEYTSAIAPCDNTVVRNQLVLPTEGIRLFIVHVK